MGKSIMRTSLNLTLNSVALGIVVYGACASLYSQHTISCRFHVVIPDLSDNSQMTGFIWLQGWDPTFVHSMMAFTVRATVHLHRLRSAHSLHALFMG